MSMRSNPLCALVVLVCAAAVIADVSQAVAQGKTR